VITENEILNYISRQPRHMAGYKQILHDLGVRGKERRPVEEMLRQLTRQKKLVAIGKERWALPTSASSQDLVVGQLRMHRDGYGFVTPDPDALPPRARGKLQGDIFIPPPEVGSAMHGDRVLVELGRIRPDGKGEGRILRVTEREQQTVVGIFHYGERYNYVRPIDEKVTAEIIIPFGMEYPRAEDEEEFQAAPQDRDLKASLDLSENPHSKEHQKAHKSGSSASPRLSGEKPLHPRQRTPHRVLGEEARRRTWDDLENVVVELEITQWPSPTQNPRGRVVEILGYEDDFGVDVEIIIRKHHIRHVFPAAVLAEAQEISPVIPHAQIGHRRNFRDQPIVTIDGETARDFDDAVLVERLPHGHYRLHVHIADVAHYVEDGSAIDEEARKRGTSVYFPDRAVPMLPLELSTDICSLRPEVERLVLSCIMEIDSQGEVLSYELAEGIIRSAARMSYTDVNAIIQGDTHLRQRYASLVTNFELMYELAQLLNRKRVKRGSIDFDLPEPVIEFDQYGMMKSVAASERNWAHRLIEEFMLAANETVATHLEKHNIASLYRIHEKPDPKRIYDFETIAASFGYSLGVGALPIKRVQTRADKRSHYGSGRRAPTVALPEEVHVTPRMYQKLVQKITGKPEERVLSYLMLRSLKQARYSEINEGHFALAAPSYTHFTSPIRRYPDLIVHRILKEVIHDHGGPMRGHLKSSEEQASPWSKRRASNESLSSLRRRENGAPSSSPRRHRDTEKERVLPSGGRGKSIFETGVAQPPSAVQPGKETSSLKNRVAQAPSPVLKNLNRKNHQATEKNSGLKNRVAQPSGSPERAGVARSGVEALLPVPASAARKLKQKNASCVEFVAQAPSTVHDRAYDDKRRSQKKKPPQACVAQAARGSQNLPCPVSPCLPGEDSSSLSTNASAHYSISYPVYPYRNRSDQHRSQKQQTHPARQTHLKTVAGLSIETLHDIADSSSQAERAADEAERELLEWKKVKFMQDRVGEDFAGLIVSTTKYGFFVELTDLFIEGLVPLDSLLDDNYTFRENTRQIIGQHSRKTWSIGDRVRVIVDRIDHVQRKIQFALYEEAPSRAQKRHKKRG
jgi:ribonuclease R